jgi:hypothetical protein
MIGGLQADLGWMRGVTELNLERLFWRISNLDRAGSTRGSR